MFAEQHKAICRRFYEEIFNQGNINAVDEFMSARFIEHHLPLQEMPRNRQGAKMNFAMLHKAFPDIHVTIEDMVAENDRVVVRLSGRATHLGEFAGVPPTGNAVTLSIIDILRFEGTRMVEHWGLTDRMSMLQQIGAVSRASREQEEPKDVVLPAS